MEFYVCHTSRTLSHLSIVYVFLTLTFWALLCHLVIFLSAIPKCKYPATVIYDGFVHLGMASFILSSFAPPRPLYGRYGFKFIPLRFVTKRQHEWRKAKSHLCHWYKSHARGDLFLPSNFIQFRGIVYLSVAFTMWNKISDALLVKYVFERSRCFIIKDG